LNWLPFGFYFRVPEVLFACGPFVCPFGTLRILGTRSYNCLLATFGYWPDTRGHFSRLVLTSGSPVPARPPRPVRRGPGRRGSRRGSGSPPCWGRGGRRRGNTLAEGMGRTGGEIFLANGEEAWVWETGARGVCVSAGTKAQTNRWLGHTTVGCVSADEARCRGLGRPPDGSEVPFPFQTKQNTARRSRAWSRVAVRLPSRAPSLLRIRTPHPHNRRGVLEAGVCIAKARGYLNRMISRESGTRGAFVKSRIRWERGRRWRGVGTSGCDRRLSPPPSHLTPLPSPPPIYPLDSSGGRGPGHDLRGVQAEEAAGEGRRQGLGGRWGGGREGGSGVRHGRHVERRRWRATGGHTSG